ncbi:capsular polysaccharide biosynthesis protein [Formosa agariphila KMM 3901]|uniref:Capsular polysaccharide biosynthesis protein n=1 Tax=Formosa agariphila (strain DSM 15362 / KCTC 12365 / LMG 23005 / KMM 3901 / M-2Alg 35-1) TaxID=1347342 RepID=T2KRU7_FORAG|nr:phenylacetate--CoA ligase family protein [Formosa agariphila]CDF81211.1 capsular polysaccharide biosynthesis protein [Formosa agariphila KMM 3901]
MKIFNLSLQFNGFPLKDAKETISKIQKLSEIEFENYLNSRKKEILQHHLNHNPFYNSFGKDIDLNNWNSVPVMTKRDLQQPLENRLSEGYTLKNVYINKTSGSSGDPFVFAKDKTCHALTWAEIQNRFGWYGIDFNSALQARFYGIPLDKFGYYKEHLKDKLSNRYRFSIFDLSDTALENYLNVFKTKPFDYINGYTSAIVQFAKYLKSKNLILNTVCPTLKCCVVTSEMLFPDDKLLLQHQFGVPVINEYGASELDLIAFQNPEDIWQANSDTLFIEVLDDKNLPLPYGQEGRIVITSLYNKAHPFIRYDLGDIGILSKTSTLQKPVLEKLLGRTNDMAILSSGKRAAGLTFYYITKAIIEDDGNVKEFIITQETKSTFKIDYVGNMEISEDKQQAIISEMKRYLESGLIIHFEKHKALKRSKSGKLKQFKSLVK